MRRVALRGVLHVQPSATQPGAWMLIRQYAARAMRVVPERAAAIAQGMALAVKKDWALVVHDEHGATVAQYDTRDEIVQAIAARVVAEHRPALDYMAGL